MRCITITNDVMMLWMKLLTWKNLSVLIEKHDETIKDSSKYVLKNTSNAQSKNAYIQKQLTKTDYYSEQNFVYATKVKITDSKCQ